MPPQCGYGNSNLHPAAGGGLGNCRIEVASPVCRFIVNFWGYNFLSWKFISCCYGPFHQTLQAWSKPTGEKVVLVHPAAHWCSRSWFVTLIVSKPVLFNYSSVFIDCVLCHDIHWCQKYTWDSINLAQRNQSMVMDLFFLWVRLIESQVFFWHQWISWHKTQSMNTEE